MRVRSLTTLRDPQDGNGSYLQKVRESILPKRHRVVVGVSPLRFH